MSVPKDSVDQYLLLNATDLDRVAQTTLGQKQLMLSPLEARLCALAFGELQRTAPRTRAAGSMAQPADLLHRRCAIPALARSPIDTIVNTARSVDPRQRDFSCFWHVCPLQDDHPRSKLVIETPGVCSMWLNPMRAFCSALEPGSEFDQRAELHDLLLRCGWATEPRALRLVLDELCWDTVELLQFALHLLRRHYHQLWLPLAGALESEVGAEAVRPLRKLLDPDLTLALVVAAPERTPVSKKKKKEEEEENDEEMMTATMMIMTMKEKKMEEGRRR